MPDPTLTVTQLTRKIRTLLEIQVGEVWVEGEISNYRPNKSGHVYFTLKDEHAQLACVLFRGRAARVKFQPGEGMQVRAFGEISVYEARGSYQLVVKTLEEKGAGALQARFEALKRKLQEEGLFGQDRKQPIPRHPAVVALVTSPTGAAVRDLVDVLQRRAPATRLLLAPVSVQGKGAEKEITAAIEMLNRESGSSLPAIDTLIVGRGGGSLEDLWCFNEEVVARAVAASRIPVISAVGHEIDFTICDFAADLRAPTPSAAAELAVPDTAELKHRLATLRERGAGAAARLLRHHAEVLRARSPDNIRRAAVFLLREQSQRLDGAESDLRDAWTDWATARSDRLGRASTSLAASRPDIVLREATERAGGLGQRLHRAGASRLDRARDRLAALGELLRSLGPEGVLRRGFTLTLDADGQPVRSARGLAPGQRIVTKFPDGERQSEVV